MRKRFFYLIAYIFFMGTLNAQPLHIETYTPANGLLDTRVIKIFQDNRGLLYFLTWEGISIFDGQRFRNITEYNGEGLGLVNEMVQGENDTCYVFTFQKGVFKLFQNRLFKDTLFNGIIEPSRVIQAGTDKIIAANSGLYLWNKNSLQQLKQENRFIKDAESVVFRDGYLIYSRQTNSEGNALIAMEISTGRITATIPGKRVDHMIMDERKNVLLKINNEWLQLDNHSLQTGNLKLQTPYFQPFLPAALHMDRIFMNGKLVWISENTKGYILLHAETGKKEFYPASTGLTAGADAIFSDKENNYWFIFFKKYVQKASSTRLRPAFSSSLPAMVSLLNDENNNPFAGSANELYFLKDTTIILAKKFPITAATVFYWQNRSWSFQNNKTIVSDQGDVVDLSGNGSSDPGYYISYQFSFDKEGRLLIPGRSLFVVEKDLSVHTSPLEYFTDNIVTDENNNYWAFARNGSIHSYSLSAGRLQRNDVSYKVADLNPRFVLHWNRDTFCTGTRSKGIVWLSLKEGRLEQLGKINAANGLSNNFVTCLLKKNNRQLYAATGFGLDEITISNNDTTIQNLSAGNNLYIPFNAVVYGDQEGIYAKSEDGRLWYISNKGAALPDFIPEVWLDEIQVNGKTVSIANNQFTYNQNNFRFSVTAPCFTDARNIRYYFILQNENKNWQQQSPDNIFSMNNLSPGKYSLTVTISYPGKIYPDKKIVHSFIIQPPVWKQWWFIVMAIFIAAFILWIIIRAYFLRKMAIQKAEAEKKQAIERERNRISRDMHDDLGSGLTKIAILSEVAKKQLPEPEKAKEQLEKISESSRELVDNLQDIIWVLNPKNDTLENLSAYIREYALKYFEPLAIKLQFNYPEQFLTGHLSEEKRRNVFLTVKESLHNIAKHAWCNQVTISILEQAQHFEIIIEDDGKGFDPEKVRLFANGLKNMQTRIEQVGGTYRIQSETGKGTTTKIIMTV